MSRTQFFLLLLIAGEVLCGGWMVSRRLLRPLPPRADLAGYNPHTARQIRVLTSQLSPDVAADWARLGDVYLAHGFFPESEASYRRAVNLEPSAELTYRWALCLSSMGRLDEAKQRLHDALAAGYAPPSHCWYLIGRLELRDEHLESAQRAFQQAGGLPAARYERAKIDVRAGRADTARDILKQLESEFPDAFQVHLLRARAEAMLGNNRLATSYLDLSEVCSGHLPNPTHEFGEHILATLDHFSATQIVNQGAELLAVGRVEQAEALVRNAFDGHWDPEVEDLWAAIEFHRGHLDAQRQRLAAIIERDGASSHGLWRLGLAMSAAGKLTDAAQMHRAAVKLNTDPHVIDSLEQLTLLYQQLGDHSQAQHFAARFRYMVGVELFRQARLAEARAALEESVSIDDTHAHAWFYLGQIARFLGNRQAARAAYDRCLKLDPDYGRALAASQTIDTKNE